MTSVRNIACIGAGPAGLYFAILAKQSDPARNIDVYERNLPEDKFGWGVVFSDQTMEKLLAADADSCHEISSAFQRWDDVEVHFRGRTIRSSGHGFSGIARDSLLQSLRRRARALGVTLHAGTRILRPEQWSGYDLVVGADGVHSDICQHYRQYFKPRIDTGRNRFIWLGTEHRFDSFTFDFRETERGWFILHGYCYDANASTVVIETSEKTWRDSGLDNLPVADMLAFCQRLFADRLQGKPLLCNPRHRSTSQWVNFEVKHCERWYHDNVVLLGDAAHTAHFSIGAGTRMAMEDAIALARCIDDGNAISTGLQRYQAEREPEALKIVNAARNRMQWFENVARYTGLEPVQFTYSLFTGSQRISHSNMRQRDPAFVASAEQHVASRAGIDARPAPPPMFTPFRLRDLVLPNRVVVSPMAMYSCTDGQPGNFHIAHLGERAAGGAGLVMVEMTAPAPDGRITHACAGLWNEQQMEAWRDIVSCLHKQSAARIGMQLGHSGPKGATAVPGQAGDTAMIWPLFAASAKAYDETSQVPRAMTRADMDTICHQFVSATQRANQAGFDLLELHCAHGYLLSCFLSPLTNHRNDEYGGSAENRLRYPLEVFRAMRAAWPQEKPMFVRISAHDWAPGGNTGDDAVVFSLAFKQAGADLIDVSSGQTTPLAKPVYGRMYQTTFADRIRNEIGIATMAVGNIFHHDHVNSIIAAGRADLCAIARPHLADPHWTLRAAAAQGYHDLRWPRQYERARAQFESHLAKETNR